MAPRLRGAHAHHEVEAEGRARQVRGRDRGDVRLSRAAGALRGASSRGPRLARLLCAGLLIAAAGACDPAADLTDSTRPSTLGSTPTVTTSTTPPAAGTGIPAGDDRIVDRVVDGDTLKLIDGTRVRLIGVDTPETVDPRKPVECFGKEASAYVARVLPAGTAVRLVYDVQRLDRYGRTLAYVYRLPDGFFLNAQLVAEGYASPLTIPPDVAHADLFVALAASAREAGKGLWAAC